LARPERERGRASLDRLGNGIGENGDRIHQRGGQRRQFNRKGKKGTGGKATKRGPDHFQEAVIQAVTLSLSEKGGPVTKTKGIPGKGVMQGKRSRSRGCSMYGHLYRLDL